MVKNHLIGLSIIIACLFVLASFSNVVGVQTVTSSTQKTIKDDKEQKDLLFQIILKIANNIEIQKIILKSQINKKSLFNSDIGCLMLPKIVGKSKLNSIINKYEMINKEILGKITVVIENDTEIMGKITQLSNSECNCENDNTFYESYPYICCILTIIYGIGLFLLNFNLGLIITVIAGTLLIMFQCIYP